MRSLLVTGGAGFIGANFVHFWLQRHPGDRLVILDALTYAGNPASLAGALGRPNVCFVRGDICNQSLIVQVLRDHRVSTVVHFAAESHVDRSINGPDVFLATNVIGTHALLKAARQVWLEEEGGREEVRFHHVSTDEVFGSLGQDDPPFEETTAYAPNSPYAASKASSDHLVRAYHRTFGLPVTTSNCSNNYGPYQFPEKLIPLVLVHALEGRPLPIYGDGGHVRDWLYVQDHCRAIERVLEAGRPGETYNLGGGAELQNLQLVRQLCRFLDEAVGSDPRLVARFPACPASQGKPTERLISFVPDRLGHDRRYGINPAKVQRELGFVPQESIEGGLQKTVAWYLANEAWWRAILSGKYRVPGGGQDPP